MAGPPSPSTLSLLSPLFIYHPHSATPTSHVYNTSISIPLSTFNSNFQNPPKIINMPPKGAAEKKPAAKAPAAKAPAEKKDAGKKTAATGEKKKRTKTRKETYSSYIYKGEIQTPKARRFHPSRHFIVTSITNTPQFLSRSTQILVSPTVPCPS